MIRFMCDSCGKDISDKVLDSVRQFCSREYFSPGSSEGATEGYSQEIPDLPHEMNHLCEPLHLELQLLEELLKIIHASAWDMSSAVMHCSHCAVKHGDRKKKRVITMFTKTVDQRHNTPYGKDNCQGEINQTIGDS